MTVAYIVPRCTVLLLAAAWAMPVPTNARHVRGGTVAPCDTTLLDQTGTCAAKLGKECDPNKTVCQACQLSGQQKQFICKDTDTAACPDLGCVTGQTQSELAGQSCITQPCP